MGWRNGRAARNKNRREKCNKASTAIGLISLVWFGVGVVICRDGVVEMGFAAKGLNREGGALTVFKDIDYPSCKGSPNKEEGCQDMRYILV